MRHVTTQRRIPRRVQLTSASCAAASADPAASSAQRRGSRECWACRRAWRAFHRRPEARNAIKTGRRTSAFAQMHTVHILGPSSASASECTDNCATHNVCLWTYGSKSMAV
eukprot:316258-Pleurochrysis_carterae.AAC.4